MNLFPAGLDTSLFPAIVLGVLVTFVAVETLGWTFTGLVVPGYLASVALVAPRAALLMIAEALITVAVVRLLSDGAAAARVGSRFFGRERFFMTLAIATGVRLIVDHALLPPLVEHGGPIAAFALREGEHPVHSIGLVLVPLMAHTIDRVGALRGIVQLGALTATTGAIVALLLRTTNLSLADLSLTFEDVALAIDRSPASYVVLLCGALLAARANVAFGWDFHGIIVPGLLAVAWFTPIKVAVTLIEALAALALSRVLLSLPGLRRMQVEGPRRLVVIFLADGVIKFAVAGAMGTAAPGFGPTELGGFGYLLPALLATKIWQRRSAARVLFPAAQVSFGGFLIGNALVLGLGRLAIWLAPPAVAGPFAPGPPLPFDRAIAVATSSVARDGGSTQLSSKELALWTSAWRDFAAGRTPRDAFSRLTSIGVSLEPIEDRSDSIVVRERVARLGDLRGLGTVIARDRGRRVIVAMPRPLDGELSLAAIGVVRAVDARAVVIAGRPDGAGDAGRGMFATPYGVAASSIHHDAWLALSVDETAPAGGTLRVDAARWPDKLDLVALRELFPALQLEWRGGGGTGAVLAAPRETWRRVASRPCDDDTEVELSPARGGRELGLEERLFAAERIYAPLDAAARGDGDPSGVACRAAAVLGLRAVRVARGEERFLALLPETRRALTALVRIGGGGHVVGVPARADHAIEAGVALGDALRARAVLVGAGSVDYDAALESWFAAPGVTTLVEVRGGGPGARAIVAWGGVAGEPSLAPAWLEPIERALSTVGLPSRRYDGGFDSARHGGLDDRRRSALARLGHGRLATVWLPQSLRAARFGAQGVVAATSLARELGIPVVDQALDDVFHGRGDGDACSVDFDDVFARARRWAQRRHVADLRALAARRGVRVAVDPLSRERAVVGSGCDGRAFAVNLRDAGEPIVEASIAGADETSMRALRLGGVAAMIAEARP